LAVGLHIIRLHVNLNPGRVRFDIHIVFQRFGNNVQHMQCCFAGFMHSHRQLDGFTIIWAAIKRNLGRY
jgi:hypothetical protein